MQKQRKFELLKDFGASKKWDIFTGPVQQGAFDVYEDQNEELMFLTNQVENNPEYFREIVEKKELEWEIGNDRGLTYWFWKRLPYLIPWIFYKKYKDFNHHSSYMRLMRHIEEMGKIEFGEDVVYILDDFTTFNGSTYDLDMADISAMEIWRVLPYNSTKEQIKKRIELLKNFLSFYK